jgi:hypothetical protein
MKEPEGEPVHPMTARFDTSAARPSFLHRLRDRLAPGNRGRQELIQHNDRLESFLRAIPIDYCGWDQSGLQAMSAGFVELLGVPSVASIDDICAALAPSDAATIASLYDRLRDFGEHFEVGVHTVAARAALVAICIEGAYLELRSGRRVDDKTGLLLEVDFGFACA